jgi:hypothetical protein
MISDIDCAKLVLATYGEVEAPEKFKLIHEIDTGPPADTQLSIYECEHTVVLAFPGTVNFWDWVTNLSALFRLDRSVGRVSGPRGQRSRFPRKKTLNAWRRRWLSIEPEVSKIIRKYDHVICTGHSLGGALAVSALCTYHSQGNMDTYGVLFGTPRCATEYLRIKLAGCPITRYTNCLDLVTQMPCFGADWGVIGSEVKLMPTCGGIKANHSMKLYKDRVTDHVKRIDIIV